MTGPLAGVRIIEIAGIGPGPFAGMLLADLGAEVISIERPSTASARQRAAQIFNRGKRSVVLDLKAQGAIDVVFELIRDADGLIEGMRPGVMERLGLGPEPCLAVNPALVYGRMTGWGQTGPLAQAAGHDSNYTALAGVLHYAGQPDEPQLAPATVIGDVGGGALYLVIGMLAAILRARQDGQGQVVDAAIVDGAAHMSNLLLSMVAGLGGSFERGRHMFDASHWAGRSYRCSDGGWVNIAPLEPQFYALFLGIMGLGDDSRFTGGQMQPELWPVLTQELASIFATQPRAHWCALLEATDCCFAPVLSPSEAASHPHMQARSVFHVVGDVLQAAPAPRFSRTAPDPQPRIAPQGSATAEVLGALGCSHEQIALMSGGVLAAS